MDSTTNFNATTSKNKSNLTECGKWLLSALEKALKEGKITPSEAISAKGYLFLVSNHHSDLSSFLRKEDMQNRLKNNEDMLKLLKERNPKTPEELEKLFANKTLLDKLPTKEPSKLISFVEASIDFATIILRVL